MIIQVTLKLDEVPNPGLQHLFNYYIKYERRPPSATSYPILLGEGKIVLSLLSITITSGMVGRSSGLGSTQSSPIWMHLRISATRSSSRRDGSTSSSDLPAVHNSQACKDSHQITVPKGNNIIARGSMWFKGIPRHTFYPLILHKLEREHENACLEWSSERDTVNYLQLKMALQNQ